MSSALRLVVVGVGADGWPGLAGESRRRVLEAEVVLGGARHLELLPPAPDQVRVPWPSPLREQLPRLLGGYAGRRIVVLASGDPLVSGIGSTLIEILGSEAVEIVPALSSVALGRARMGWAAESVEVITLVGRDRHALLRSLAPAHRLLVLSSDEHTPDAVAQLLCDAGYGRTLMTVLGDLGAMHESRTSASAAEWSGGAPRLNVIALDLVGPVIGAWTSGLPDDAFENDGQLTKRDLRASALARLAPQPGQLLWDVGAGAGSVGIEWMRAHPTCRTIAVDSHPERAARIARNAQRLGVPALAVVEGRAPEALEGLPQPDAIFVGGGATSPGLVDLCVEQLASGGRLVVHGVTLQTEATLADAYARHGGELTRTQTEQATPIGTFTGWTPARMVTQWVWTKPIEETS